MCFNKCTEDLPLRLINACDLIICIKKVRGKCHFTKTSDIGVNGFNFFMNYILYKTKITFENHIWSMPY